MKNYSEFTNNKENLSMATLSTRPPTLKRNIVRNRWRARTFFWQALSSMPKSTSIRNDREGNRLETPIIVDLKPSLENLRIIGLKIFHRNFNRDYVAISTKNNMRISYTRTLKDKYSERRLRTKLGRYITRNFREEMENINERALDLLVEKFSALAADDLDLVFERVSGSEIMNRYTNSFADSSCMTEDGSKYTRMYKDTEGVEMLCLDDGRYKGRALLWHTPDGSFLDRIYPNSGPHVEKYELYCEKHGIDIRNDNQMPSTGPDSDDGLCWPTQRFRSGESYSLEITIPKSYAPFVDTMHWGKWLNEEEGKAIISSDPENFDNRPDFALNGIGGEVRQYHYDTCELCHLEHHTNRLSQIPDINGRRTDEMVCMTCRRDTCTECYNCGDIHRNENIIRFGRPGRIERSYCVNCTIEKVSLCGCCNELIIYIPKSINGVKYCEKCYANIQLDRAVAQVADQIAEMNPNEDED